MNRSEMLGVEDVEILVLKHQQPGVIEQTALALFVDANVVDGGVGLWVLLGQQVLAEGLLVEL